ncbi:MAG TPA: hypothetical protein PL110_09405, partial [Candidatus Eremiobacteraeota bacterium]|nr:hypothetical protein [Candidatus Eremiobacteraeota bacterium]
MKNFLKYLTEVSYEPTRINIYIIILRWIILLYGIVVIRPLSKEFLIGGGVYCLLATISSLYLKGNRLRTFVIILADLGLLYCISYFLK